MYRVPPWSFVKKKRHEILDIQITNKIEFNLKQSSKSPLNMSYFQEKMSVLNCLCVMWSWTVLSVLFLLGTVFLRTVFLAYMCLTRPCLFKTQRWMSFYYNFYYFRSFSSEYTTCKHVGLFWCFFLFLFFTKFAYVCVCVSNIKILSKNSIFFFFPKCPDRNIPKPW